MQIVSDRDGGVMVLVPGGTFVMGREDGEPAEGPPHRVFVSTYYIDQHEVTVRQFVQFLKETGRPLDAAKLMPRETTDPPANEDFPAVNVSSVQAKAYCTWARKRLPTEAQWEYAARSSDGRVSYWNGELPRKDPPNGPRTVAAVMTLPSDVSPFGAYDMAANAWEWTSEFWDSQYYQQFRNTVVDPAGPKQSRARPVQMTVKGGSKVGILTWREGQKSETRLPYLGFRGVLPVEGAPVAPAAAPVPAPTTPNAGAGLPPL
jgi:formylglycine-generating enzyme required for sulfatase activity